ncbi:MotB family protein [Amorphus sp. 3PC139-8]|uniref:MotB family protein n=1 Tax=Amorphus sp. 3PC139-8 TaxID=2735676 RepID=UPI00345D2A27
MSGQEHHELIIIKRGEDEEHEHHSSAWKVAHADFMTAMMAFFLIMWLINVTDEEVRKMVAAYFNPVDLAASMAPQKGVEDPEDAPLEPADLDKGEGPGDGAGEQAAVPTEAEVVAREKAAFQDPYAILAKLAAQVDPDLPTALDAPEGEAGDPGESGGDILRDPFDPVYWQTDAARPAVTETPGTPGTMEKAPDETQRPNAAIARASADVRSGGPKSAAADRDLALTGAAPILKTGPDSGGSPADAAAAVALSEELQATLSGATNETGSPHLEVMATDEGVLVSLTDDIDFAMFPIGSAIPDPKVVKVMERVAEALTSQPGQIVVRGYTDARPFRSDSYDNWRLSSARAHMAQYMLVRGGIDEERIQSIEGHADRDPKNSADPNAAENRRIEILLREPATGTRP